MPQRGRPFVDGQRERRRIGRHEFAHVLPGESGDLRNVAISGNRLEM
jgi:hypothetical protein